MLNITEKQFKNLAKILSKDNHKDLSHNQILNEMSKVFGFQSYNALKATHFNQGQKETDNFSHPLIEPSADRNLDVLGLKSADEVPNDIFACCLDSKLFDQAVKYMVKFNVNDYRVFVATDSKLRKHVEELLEISL